MQSERKDGTMVLDFSVHLTGDAAVAFLDKKRREEITPTDSALGAALISRALGVTKGKPQARRKAG